MNREGALRAVYPPLGSTRQSSHSQSTSISLSSPENFEGMEKAMRRREVDVEPEVPGIRIAARDLRVGRGRASEGMSGGETREGVEGAFSIGEGDGAGVTVGAGVGMCRSPNPGGKSGSGKFGTAPPSTPGMPETTTSETTGYVGGLSPSEARSRSTA